MTESTVKVKPLVVLKRKRPCCWTYGEQYIEEPVEDEEGAPWLPKVAGS
jgi:hypothetical protein